MSKVYLILPVLIFLSSFMFSQSRQDISDIQIENTTEYLVASAANWNSEIEVYFNSKVLSTNRDIKYLGLNYVGKTCGDEYCFKFSEKQSDYDQYQWYPSSIGIDADFFRYLGKKINSLGFSKISLLFFVYLIFLCLNLAFYGTLIRTIFNGLTSKIAKLYLLALFLSPWLLFGASNIMFAPALRFMPCFLYLYLVRQQNLIWSSAKFNTLMIFAFAVSTLHGYEFSSFLFAMCLLLPNKLGVSMSSWVKKWITWLAAGYLVSFFLWFSINFFNSRNLLVSIEIIIHTMFKQSRLADVSTPKFAIDSGYDNLPHWRGMLRFFFETSSVLPHPIPSQILDLPFAPFFFHILVVATSLGTLLVCLFILKLKAKIGHDPIFYISILSLIVATWLLSSYLYYHRHFMGLCSAMLCLLYANYGNSLLVKKMK